MKLTIYFNLVRGLRISGALPPFSVDVFVAFRGTFFFSFLSKVKNTDHLFVCLRLRAEYHVRGGVLTNFRE